MQIDETDRRLLRALQAEPSLGARDLARRAGISASQSVRRIDRLERAGVIKGFGVVVDPAARGIGVSVSLRITLDKTSPRAFDEFLAAARDVPGVREIQTLLGRVDVRLVIETRDLGDYQRVYRDAIQRLPHVLDIEALMSIATVKSHGGLPL